MFSPTHIATLLITVAVISAGVDSGPTSAVHTEYPQRFWPEDLRQDGRVTLPPAFSPDGRTIYFAQSECSPIWECPQQLKRSRRTEHGWSPPENIQVFGQGRVDWPSVSPDGKTLWFSWAGRRARHKGEDVDVDFDIFSLDLGDETASPLAIDEPDINRIRGGANRVLRFVNNEAAPHLTRDGDLYFWTERLDGVGERDVYLAPSDGKGGFLTARPLEAPINSRGRDQLGWISPEGDLMLLTYDGRGGSGEDDIFVSRKTESGWSEPENLGPKVNSAYADSGARLSPDRRWLVFSSTRPFEGQSAGLIQVWYLPTENLPALHGR